MISDNKAVLLKFIYLLLLFPLLSNATDLNELQLINGTWKCTTNYHGDYIQTEVVSLISYDVEKSIYAFKGTVIFTTSDSSLKSSVESTSKGSFSYSDSKLTSEPKDVEVRLIEDKIGILSPEAMVDLKAKMETSDNQQYITKELTVNFWRRLNPKDGDLIECYKVDKTTN
jgi:hypothetical protein